MRWWMRLRLVSAGAAISFTVLPCACLFGALPVSFPSFVGQAGLVAPMGFLLPCLTASVLAAGLDGQNWADERTAVRPVAWLDIGYAAALGLPSAVGRLVGGPEVLVEVTRNTLGLAGLVLSAAWLIGPTLSALPSLLWTLVAAVAGRRDEGFHPWAWPVLASDNATWTWALGTFAVGAALYAGRSRLTSGLWRPTEAPRQV